ncbi:sugar transporter ERD6-like 16 [Silene latifolia]|uniref:sugar transporter ERD6-like 16 n=1 Tax=Silene latifolia TaxID=37657 RepID=UPI003D776BE1
MCQSLRKGPISLDAGRFLTGWGIGIFSYVVPVYVSEIAPTSIRGGLTTLNQLMIVLGISFTMLLGIAISWRGLALHEDEILPRSIPVTPLSYM